MSSISFFSKSISDLLPNLAPIDKVQKQKLIIQLALVILGAGVLIWCLKRKLTNSVKQTSLKEDNQTHTKTEAVAASIIKASDKTSNENDQKYPIDKENAAEQQSNSSTNSSQNSQPASTGSSTSPLEFETSSQVSEDSSSESEASFSDSENESLVSEASFSDSENESLVSEASFSDSETKSLVSEASSSVPVPSVTLELPEDSMKIIPKVYQGHSRLDLEFTSRGDANDYEKHQIEEAKNILWHALNEKKTLDIATLNTLNLLFYGYESFPGKKIRSIVELPGSRGLQKVDQHETPEEKVSPVKFTGNKWTVGSTRHREFMHEFQIIIYVKRQIDANRAESKTIALRTYNFNEKVCLLETYSEGKGPNPAFFNDDPFTQESPGFHNMKELLLTGKCCDRNGEKWVLDHNHWLSQHMLITSS